MEACENEPKRTVAVTRAFITSAGDEQDLVLFADAPFSRRGWRSLPTECRGELGDALAGDEERSHLSSNKRGIAVATGVVRSRAL